MKVTLTDVCGQTIILYDVTSVFSSIVEDDVICVKVFGEQTERWYNVKTLNYFCVTDNKSGDK